MNISDVTAIINYILNRPPESFDIDNANANGDDFININDVTAVINIILNNKDGFFIPPL